MVKVLTTVLYVVCSNPRAAMAGQDLQCSATSCLRKIALVYMILSGICFGFDILRYYSILLKTCCVL